MANINRTLTLQLKEIPDSSAHIALTLAYKHATMSAHSIASNKEWNHDAERMVTKKSQTKAGNATVTVEMVKKEWLQ